MDTNELMLALSELEKTKRIKKDVLLDALEAALISAYKRNYGGMSSDNVFAIIDRESGNMRVFCQKTVVEEVENPETEISLEEAKEVNPRYQVGDFVELEADPAKFGRIAAQTAKQIVVQRIREAERGNIYSEYSGKESQVLVGTVQKSDSYGVLVDIGNIEALLSPNEQIPGEEYRNGDRINVYVLEVRNNARGPQVTVSRTHPGLIKKLLEKEVPEIADGTVEIKNISREAGSRTKISVFSTNENVDPVGSCVGQKGSRIAAVLADLGEEKIDVIKYSENPSEYIAASLSPATVQSVEIDEESKSALVVVPEFQLSLAIGKEGQNARLAARLTGWKIDIKSDSGK